MSDTKLSSLTAAITLGGSELVYGVQSAASVKITANQVKTFILTGLTLPWGSVTSPPTTISGYGITDAVPTSRTVNGQALSGNVTITTITGNAGTATALQTARTINGTSFDGTANITVTAAAGTLTGTSLNSTVVGSSLTSVGTIATGVWQGTLIGPTYGGTGVNNGSFTITCTANATIGGTHSGSSSGTNTGDQAVVRNGTGLPSGVLGVNGDYFISTSDGLFVKSLGSYSLIIRWLDPTDIGVNVQAFSANIVKRFIKFTFPAATGPTDDFFQCPWSGTITKSTITGKVSTSAVVDIWKVANASFPPTVANTITASAKPTLSSAQKSVDSTLSGWTTSVAAGDWFRATKSSGIDPVSVELEITQS